MHHGLGICKRFSTKSTPPKRHHDGGVLHRRSGSCSLRHMYLERCSRQEWYIPPSVTTVCHTRSRRLKAIERVLHMRATVCAHEHSCPPKQELNFHILYSAGDEIFQTKQPRGAFYVFADKVRRQLLRCC